MTTETYKFADESVQLLLTLAQSYVAAGRHGEAAEIYRNLNVATGPTAELTLRAAAAYEDAGQQDRALQYLEWIEASLGALTDAEKAPLLVGLEKLRSAIAH
jgi:hypothetical protein